MRPTLGDNALTAHEKMALYKDLSLAHRKSEIDLNNMILKYLHKAPATDYFNSFLDLADSGVLDLDFALEIAPSTGLRDILVHEYTKIDDAIVYHSIENLLAQYGHYLQEINKYLDCEMEW